jgi:hypothetical protein
MSLDICSSGHNEIVYQAGGAFSGYNKCPVCELTEEKEGLAQQVNDLEIKIEDLESQE